VPIGDAIASGIGATLLSNELSTAGSTTGELFLDALGTPSPSQGSPQNNPTSDGDLISSTRSPVAEVVTGNASSTRTASSSSIARPPRFSAGVSAGFGSTNATNQTLSGCLASLVSYASANNSWYGESSHLTVTWITYTITTSTWTNPVSVPYTTPYTTLCDGWPRAHGSYGEFSINVTSSYSNPVWAVASSYPARPPTCQLDSMECGQWWTSHMPCWYTSFMMDEPVAASCTPYVVSERVDDLEICKSFH
jgi:hypothetical protein